MAFDISSALVLLQHQGYLFTLVLMIIEGPIINVLAAFAASLGLFNIWIIFLIALLGDLGGDVAHYIVGYILRKHIVERYDHKLGLTKEKIKSLEKKLKNHFWKSVIIIKLFPPLTTPGLLLVGALKIPVKDFTIVSLALAIPKTIFFTAMGYFFGAAAVGIVNYFNFGNYFIPIVIVTLVALYIVYRLLTREVEEIVSKN